MLDRLRAFINARAQLLAPSAAAPAAPLSPSARAPGATDAIERAQLYRFKRDVLMLVAKLNRGVSHPDCEALKRQVLFVQTQLFHGIYHDRNVAPGVKRILMDYHLKTVKDAIADRRGGRDRQPSVRLGPNEARN